MPRSERARVPELLESADCVFVQGELPSAMRANAESIPVRAGASGRAGKVLVHVPIALFRDFIFFRALLGTSLS